MQNYIMMMMIVNYGILWRRQQQPTPVLLPGESHGWRSLVGSGPWGRKESDTTERLRFHFSLSCIGEGNGNPLQCSCLENPRDWGAWWAAVYGVTQSRTRLKWLSSSSSVWDTATELMLPVEQLFSIHSRKIPQNNPLLKLIRDVPLTLFGPKCLIQQPWSHL